MAKSNQPKPSIRSAIAANSGKKRRGASSSELIFFAIITLFSCLSIALNVMDSMSVDTEVPTGMMHHPVLQHPKFKDRKKIKQMMDKMNSFKAKIGGNMKKRKNVKNNEKTEESESKLALKGANASEKSSGNGKPKHSLGGLQCSAFGGPPDEVVAKEMVYWSDIPSDANYVSPFRKNNEANNRPTQYMTFEPDGGGWNNIRMAMETVVVMAHAMGRTLVLPPSQGMYLLRKDKGKQNTDFSFADFFHLESLSKEHKGIDIISTEEFMTKVAMTGHLRNKTSGLVQFPPGNRTNWDGEDLNPYKAYMRDVIYTPLWSPGSCLAAFPESGDPKDITDLTNMRDEIFKEHAATGRQQFENNPTPVDAESSLRMKEALAHRRELCIYNEEMQQEPVLHFMCYHKKHVRLLTHFYTFLYFEDWKQQLWEHRFVRDHLRYLDELQCAAGRVVEELRKIAAKEVEGNPDGLFDSVHIRRGDFQYKDTRLEADKLVEKSADVLHKGALLYIATDERKKDFFEPFKKDYKLYYLDDFKHLVS